MIRFPLKNCSTFKSNTAVLPGVFKIPANRVLSSNRHHPKIRFIQALPSYLGFPNQSRRYMDEGDVSGKTSPPLISACATGVIQYPLYLQYPHESCPAAASLINSQVTINSKEQRETRREKPRCNICKRDFSRKSSLIVHMRKHNGEKPYKCTHCPKAFTQSANLITHVRTHTGEKPYACSVCGKCFSQSSSVTTHMRTHTGERPFRCADCGMAFAERSTLSKHFRVHNRKRNLKAISKQGWV